MELAVGLQVFKNGVPVRLLYRVAQLEGKEIWHTKPLFVKQPERDEVFEPHDRITKLHTQKE